MSRRSLPFLALLPCLVAAPAAEAAAKPYDFNADGRQERVAGIPAMKVEGKRRAGAVLVIDGSSRRVITEASAGLPGDSYADSFGTAVASGDFNDDGFADLAVGSDEWDDAAGVSRGGVTVFYGSTRGLTIAGAVQFQGAPQTAIEDGESYVSSSGFGSGLAAGDLNSDGADDLVVGATNESPKPDSDTGYGAIHLLFGGPTGLTRTGERVLKRPRRDDTAFGLALALGDIDRDGHVDIVEGAPGSASSIDFGDIAGHLSYCPGAAAGPTACRAVSPKQRSNTGGDGRRREAPASIAVGDVTGDGFPDIVEGVPEDRVNGEDGTAPSGAILIRRGTKRGPSTRVLRINQATRGVPGRSDERDRFGAAVAVGRLNRDRFADIVIGATGENGHYPKNEWASLSGRVTVLHGGKHGISTHGATAFDRRTPGLPRTTLGFGASLTLLDINGDHRLDLTAGSAGLYSNDDDGQAKGSLVTLLGSRRGLTTRKATGIDWTDIGVGPRTGTGLGSVVGR